MKALKANQYKVANSYFRKALITDPDNAEAYTDLGILYNQLKEYDQAIMFFQQALRHKEDNKELIYNNIGMIYAKTAQHEKALQMFEKALTAGVRSVAIYRNIGTLCLMMGDFKGAIDAYACAIEHHPTLEISYVDMLNETLSRFDADEAKRDGIYRAAIDSVREQSEIGILGLDLSEYDSVVLDGFIAGNKKLNDDYKKLASAYNKLGVERAKNAEYELALAAFKSAVRNKPDYEDAVENLKNCERMLGLDQK